VKVEKESTVVGRRCEVKRFVANSGDSGIKGWANQGVVNAFRTSNVRSRLFMMGEFLLPDVEELTLLTDLLEACIVFENGFVEVTCEYDQMVSSLDVGRMGNKRKLKIVESE
jgi:hypothetical protein